MRQIGDPLVVEQGHLRLTRRQRYPCRVVEELIRVTGNSCIGRAQRHGTRADSNLQKRRARQARLAHPGVRRLPDQQQRQGQDRGESPLTHRLYLRHWEPVT